MQQSFDNNLKCFTSFDEGISPDFPCSAQLKAGEYSEALTALESRLAETPQSVEAKLGWLICQIELNLVPAAALTAPLEEIYGRLKERPDLDRLSVSCLAKLGLKLVQKGQRRIALLSLERALDLAQRQGSFRRESLEALRATVVSVIEEEIKRPDNRRDAAQSRAALDARLKEVRALSLNSKTLLEDSPGVDKPGVTAAKPTEETSIQQPTADGFVEGMMPMAVIKGRDRRGVLPVALFYICLLFLFAAGAYALIVGQADTGGFQVAMAAPDFEGGLLTLPEITRVDVSAMLVKESGNPNLDKVKERLSNLTVKQPEKPAKDPQASYYDPNLPAHQAVAKLDSKVVQDVPTLDPAALVANTHSVDPATAKVAIGPDGRPYGPPIQDGGKQTALDGSKLQGYPVEQFDTPVLYRTITATKVLDAPSVLARSVDALGADAKVQVVSRMGRWLELRSTGGRRGYIYAQDATEIK